MRNGKRKEQKPIYTFDIETDPFDGRSDIQPFTCGLYVGNNKFYSTWGKNCISEMKAILNTLPPGIVYAHNGGNFDMYFCMDWFVSNQDMLIINSRIVKGNISRDGKSKNNGWKHVDDDIPHEFRDSYAIMPFALKKYKKDTIDYRTFTKQERVKNKASILKYLEGDCRYLHELCTSFRDRFGDQLTIGSTAIKELKKLHKFDCLDEREDKSIRDCYFYGGRVQCFERGMIKPTKGNRIVYYDLNQCYPHVMRNMLHPISKPNKLIGNEITRNTYFVTVHGRNHNAFPVRTDNGLVFNKKRGIFSVSIHEYNAAIETGLFECDDVIECIDFDEATSFDKFVDKYHKLRKNAQESGDDIGSLFYKYVGNSAYGKFAQNPENYYNFKLTDVYTNPNSEPDARDWNWQLCTLVEFAGYMVWRQKTDNNYRYNVATGASITGGARSLLIRALAKAERPLYCDTDSIVCERLTDVPIDATMLGHWKIEATGNLMAIAGRKMYALFSGTDCVKDAHKGALLTPQQIVKIAKGATIRWKKEAPTFNFKNHTATYMHRDVKMTTTDVMDDNDEYGD